MSDDAKLWKDKYLHSLEEQERLEQLWQTQLDLLRRALVRSSLAAEGVDRSIDQCMRDLREAIRGEDLARALAALLPRLEKTLLGAEQRRETRLEQTQQALRALIGQLLQLDLPSEVRKPLRQLERGLSKRLEQSMELPALLAELSNLQGQALNAGITQGQESRPGLLARLFGGSEAPADASPAAEPQAVAVSTTVTEEAKPFAQVVALDSLPAPDELLRPKQTVNAEEDPFALPEQQESGYAAIASHIEPTLLSLLDNLDLPESHHAQVQSLREKITAGLNLYELVPVLDDLAVLLRALETRGVHEFKGYLQQLNERLALFQEGLRSTHEGNFEAAGEARALDAALRDQVDGLQNSVREAGDLQTLKVNVEGRLNGLLSALEQMRTQRENREAEVATRLQELSERVSSMELEAQAFQQHLEQERQKALLDALTGLPNRAAWNERLELEQARLNRYGGELQLAVIDVDFFKRINDNYGHLAGDKVLKLIASELAKRLRKTDFIARFGGEEFVVLLPATPLNGAQQLMENLRQAIEACPFHFRGEPVCITISIGLTAFATGEAAEQVFERADQALYRAKASGRNCVQLG